MLKFGLTTQAQSTPYSYVCCLSGFPLLLFHHQCPLPGLVRHDQHRARRHHRQDPPGHLRRHQHCLLLCASSLQGENLQKSFVTKWRKDKYLLFVSRLNVKGCNKRLFVGISLSEIVMFFYTDPIKQISVLSWGVSNGQVQLADVSWRKKGGTIFYQTQVNLGSDL